MAAKIKKTIAIFLAAVCLLASVTVFAPMRAQAAQDQINGHSLIAENDHYALYMNEEYLSIIVQDKATGAYMESAVSYDDNKNNATWSAAMRSALVLTVIYGITDTQQADLINDEVTKDITYTDNGFSAKVYWSKYKFGMTLEVELTEDGVIASVPDESIVEDGEDYFIGTISVYPYLGHSYLDQKEGYMFIPDGNGALIYLEDKEGRFRSGFTSMIYGDDPGFARQSVSNLWQDHNIINDANKVIAPVFGMAHTSEGIAYLAVVEKGPNGRPSLPIPTAPMWITTEFMQGLRREWYLPSTTATILLPPTRRPKQAEAIRTCRYIGFSLQGMTPITVEWPMRIGPICWRGETWYPAPTTPTIPESISWDRTENPGW